MFKLASWKILKQENVDLTFVLFVKLQSHNFHKILLSFANENYTRLKPKTSKNVHVKSFVSVLWNGSYFRIMCKWQIIPFYLINFKFIMREKGMLGISVRTRLRGRLNALFIVNFLPNMRYALILRANNLKSSKAFHTMRNISFKGLLTRKNMQIANKICRMALLLYLLVKTIFTYF